MHEREEFDRVKPVDENSDSPLNDPPSDDERALESLLGGFAPAAPRHNRDRLMFLAGQARALAARSDAPHPLPAPSVRPQGRRLREWLWPAATAAMTAASLVLAVALATRPETVVVYRDRPADEAPPSQRDVAKAEDNAPSAGASSPPQEPSHALVARQRVQESSLEGAHPRRLPEPHYLRQREIALTLGIEALPQSIPQSGRRGDAPLSQRELLTTLLPVTIERTPSEPSFGGWFFWPFFSDTEDQL